jgi:hypothetical protein
MTSGSPALAERAGLADRGLPASKELILRAQVARRLIERGEAKGELLLDAVAWPSEPWPP